MTNQQLVDSGNKMMDETDQTIERSKKVYFSVLTGGLLPSHKYMIACHTSCMVED